MKRFPIRCLSALFLMLLWYSNTPAQNEIFCTGYVREINKDLGLAGVNIVFEGASSVTSTGSKGTFIVKFTKAKVGDKVTLDTEQLGRYRLADSSPNAIWFTIGKNGSAFDKYIELVDREQFQHKQMMARTAVANKCTQQFAVMESLAISNRFADSLVQDLEVKDSLHQQFLTDLSQKISSLDAFDIDNALRNAIADFSEDNLPQLESALANADLIDKLDSLADLSRNVNLNSNLDSTARSWLLDSISFKQNRLMKLCDVQARLEWMEFDDSAANSIVTAALNTDPQNPQVMDFGASFFADVRNWDKALDLNRKIMDNPESNPLLKSMAYNRLGIYESEKGTLEAAIAKFNSAKEQYLAYFEGKKVPDHAIAQLATIQGNIAQAYRQSIEENLTNFRFATNEFLILSQRYYEYDPTSVDANFLKLEASLFKKQLNNSKDLDGNGEKFIDKHQKNYDQLGSFEQDKLDQLLQQRSQE